MKHIKPLTEGKITMSKPNASERFKLHVAAAKENLEKIKALIEDLEKDQEKNQSNWGYTGSMDKINTDLVEIVEFMNGDPSKVKPSR